MTTANGTIAPRNPRRNPRRYGVALALAAALGAALGAACAGPILPARSKPGGAVKWAEELALSKALPWSADATLVRVTGTGIGIEGWLPDRGGEWQLTYASASKVHWLLLEIDSDGAIRERETAKVSALAPVPPAWLDSPKVWAATRRHWQCEPLHTLDAELSAVAAPERAAGAVAWRIRFWCGTGKQETHVVTPDGRWVAMD